MTPQEHERERRAIGSVELMHASEASRSPPRARAEAKYDWLYVLFSIYNNQTKKFIEKVRTNEYNKGNR